MVKKVFQVVLYLAITFTFSFCSDEEILETAVADDADARRRRTLSSKAGSDVVFNLPKNSTRLDGSQSTGRIIKYQWSKVSGPLAGTITSPTTSITDVTSLVEGSYTFRLTVTNDSNTTAVDDVMVTVNKDGTITPPAITSFSPTSAMIGATVTISGTNFGTSPVVTFNGTAAKIVSSSATTITTTVPSGATTGQISIAFGTTVIKSVGSFGVLSTVTATTTGSFYFQGNMDNVTISGGYLSGWSDWQSKLPFVGSIYFNNSTSNKAYAFQDIRKDATGRNVMHAQIIDDDPGAGGTSRAQMTVDMSQEVPFIRTSHRMKLHPDLAHLSNYSNSIRWMTVFEMWNLRDATQGGDPAGSSRISLSLFKETGTGQPLYWHVAYEEMQPSESVKWQNKGTAKIPFGVWFTLDILVVRGIGTAGKVKVVMQEDGGQPITVFDINNNTIYRNRTDLRIKQWQVFKLYASDPIMDYMRNSGKEMSIQYNDFKWHQN